jgi:hypothetical protein
MTDRKAGSMMSPLMLASEDEDALIGRSASMP